MLAKTIKLIYILLILTAVTSAQSDSFEFYGYSKYLFTSQKYPTYLVNMLNMTSGEDQFEDHTIHTRLNSRWYASESMTMAVEMRLRAFYGGSVENIPDYDQQIKTDYDYINMDALLWNSDKSLGYGQIDRCYFDYSAEDLQITLGRQRVAWGTSWTWNVIDIFNPKSVLEFDYEENPGTDAVRIQYYTGAVTKLEVVYNPGKDKYNSTIGGLWSFNTYDYDFFFIAAFKNNRRMLGGAWSGDIEGAGFRGEFLISDPPNRSNLKPNPHMSLFGKSLYDHNETTINFVLSGDYTFQNSFYIHSEILFNSNGKKENAGVFQLETPALDMLSPARWSLYQEFAYDITPLIRGNIFAIYNPDDESSIIIPSLTWSVITDLDFTFLYYFSSGKQFTEFGVLDNLLFLRLKYSFSLL